MTATEQLTAEHAAIQEMLKIMATVKHRLAAGERVDIGHLEEIAGFLEVFVDGCHHGKEEDGLFLALLETGMPRYGGLIETLLGGHELGRRYVRGMRAGIESYQRQPHISGLQIAMFMAHYRALLDRHIALEEESLYPLADERLAPERQRQLLKEFERIEEERIGPGKHQELREALRRLQGIYPGHDEAAPESC